MTRVSTHPSLGATDLVAHVGHLQFIHTCPMLLPTLKCFQAMQGCKCKCTPYGPCLPAIGQSSAADAVVTAQVHGDRRNWAHLWQGWSTGCPGEREQ